MKIFISADIEGISGVIHREHQVSGTGDYERSRRLMTQEVNAAIKGAIDAGADEILVNDSHGSMRNIILEDLNSKARLITGFPKQLLMMEGIDASYDGVIFIGYHAMACSWGVLAHTIDGSSILSIKINGKEYGEFGLNAAIAGHFGVPILCVSGDNHLKEEVDGLSAEIEFAEVKTAHGVWSANCIHPTIVSELITEKVKRAISNIFICKPFVMEGPINLEVVLKHPSICDVVSIIPGVKRNSSTTVSYHAENIIEAMRAIATMVNASCVLSMDIYR